MALKFRRVISPIKHLEIWSASSDGFSFVISYENRTGPGFHGRPGFVASWRSSSPRSGAIRITGSPFKTFAEAEEACNVMLGHVKPPSDSKSPWEETKNVGAGGVTTRRFGWLRSYELVPNRSGKTSAENLRLGWRGDRRESDGQVDGWEGLDNQRGGEQYWAGTGR
jgi:hypothetical protein